MCLLNGGPGIILTLKPAFFKALFSEPFAE